jgi:hypothetical protein
MTGSIHGQRGSVTQRIVETIAAHDGVDPTDVPVPLYDAIDPEALDSLVESYDSSQADSLVLEFAYDGRSVVVTGDGEVRVSDPTVETVA